MLPTLSAEIYHPPERHSSYEPSGYSLLLALWNSIAFKFNRRAHLIEWVPRLLYSYPHLFAGGKLLSRMFTENLPYYPPLTEYLPWVNAYPKEWRWYLTMYSSQTWKFIDTLSNQETLANTEPDPMEWVLSALFTLSQTDSAHTVESTSKCQQIQDFYHLVEKVASYIFIMGEPLDGIKIPVTSVVENFRYKVNNSSHSCWDDYDPGWYAAAVAYLYDIDDIEFVPLLQSDCEKCAFACAARALADKISNSSSLSSSTSKIALENLFRTMVSTL